MTKTRKLMTIKPHKYGTRHLTAGEEYEAPVRHAIALVAGKKARFADKSERKKADAVIEPSGAKAPAPTSEPAMNLDDLQMEATRLGIDVDRRWGVARLQHEIAQVRD